MIQSSQVAGRFDEDLIEHRFLSLQNPIKNLNGDKSLFSMSVYNISIAFKHFQLTNTKMICSRRIELQSFTDRICRHPVLAGSEVQPTFYKTNMSLFFNVPMNAQVWKHFVSETDDKKWTKVLRNCSSYMCFCIVENFG